MFPPRGGILSIFATKCDRTQVSAHNAVLLIRNVWKRMSPNKKLIAIFTMNGLIHIRKLPIICVAGIYTRQPIGSFSLSVGFTLLQMLILPKVKTCW